MSSPSFPKPSSSSSYIDTKSMPSPQPSSSSTGFQLARDADTLIRTFLPDTETHHPSQVAELELPFPVCIPQIASGFGAPFARGYNSILAESVGISQEQLLSFIDGLNLAIVASPPLRIVDYAGMIIGFVPYHWAIIAGVVMQTTAQTAMHVLSKTLTDRYLRASNLKLFKPRGLSVRLCTTPAMQHLLDPSFLPPGSPSKTRAALNKAGRVAGTVLMRLPIPLGSRIVRAIADKPPTIRPSERTATNTVLYRRLALVEGIALPLDLDMPPPMKPDGVLDSVNAWGVKMDQWNAKRREKSDEDNRRRLATGASGSRLGQMGDQLLEMRSQGIGSDLARSMLSQRRQRRDERRISRRERRGQMAGGLIGGLLPPKESKLERKVNNADLQEHWKTDKLLWIVIMKAEIDDEIVGIQLADNQDNEEYVNDEAWREEMALEQEEEEDDLYGDDDRTLQG